MDIRDLQKEAFDISSSKGWHDEKRSIPELLMLVVSEAAEALECYRDNVPILALEEDGKPVGLASELADIVIRVADLAQANGIDLNDAIIKKMAYNKTRPHRHGGKKI